MSNPNTGIIFHRDKHPSAKSLADLTDSERATFVMCDAQVPLQEALETEWVDDAHLIMYRVDADEQGSDYAMCRVSKRSSFTKQLEEAGGRVRVTSLVFDHDLPKTLDGDKQEWSADSLEEFVVVLQDAVGTSKIPEPTAFYTTLHGTRYIYSLSQEVDQLDAEAMMRGLVLSFASAGIELDPACKDWTRLYRLPKTVREDTGQPFYTSEQFMLLTGGPSLDPSDVPRVDALRGEDSFGDIDLYEGHMPDPDECRALLIHESSNGRKYDSKAVKAGKLMLQGREAFGICFEQAPLVEGEEGWNNQITKIIGQTVGMMARHEDATPEALYAMLHSAIEQLQDRERRGANATNWFDIIWDLICRMWSNEQAQIEDEMAEQREKQAEAKVQRVEILDSLMKVQPADIPEDEEEAQDWLAHRMIATADGKHHVMRSDGSYNLHGVPEGALVPMIYDLSMDAMIPLTEVRGKSVVERSAKTIINNHATPVVEVRCSSTASAAHISGPSGGKMLHMPVHRLNPKLEKGGVFSEEVDEWLRALGGEHYDRLTEWLSHALDVGGAICALNLYGVPGTGKGMLVAGLSECFEHEISGDGRALGKWNHMLLESPIVNCDEGVPKISSDEALTVDQAFRSLVTGGNIVIRAMHRNPFISNIYPRIIFTSNDRDIIKSIVGHRDLTDEDVQAIEIRLLSIEITERALILLTNKGNMTHTKGWVSGSVKSDYVLANHIYYLYNNRKPTQTGTGRLLVEGEQSTELVHSMRTRSKSAQTVMRVLMAMMEQATSPRDMHMHNGRVWVLPKGLVAYTETNLPHSDGLTLNGAARALKQFRMKTDGGDTPRCQPPGIERVQRARWVEIDLGQLLEDAMMNGYQGGRVETLLSKQIGGPERIEDIMRMLPGGDND